jgi:hypothetical protein
MNQSVIFYPVIALVALTFFIAFAMLRNRFAAVKNREITIKYFQLNQGEIPVKLQRLSDNYDNLLSMPMLFYIATVIVYVLQILDTGYLVLAWLYVFSRYAHSYIHTVYNNVIHRMFAFVFSSLILIAIWVRAFIYLFNLN